MRIDHHDVGGTNQIVPLEIAVSSSVRVTVNTYFLYVGNTESTDRDSLWYRYGKYQEIPTDTDRKIPIWYNSRKNSACGQALRLPHKEEMLQVLVKKSTNYYNETRGDNVTNY